MGSKISLSEKQKSQYQKWLREERKKPHKPVSARRLKDALLVDLDFMSRMNSYEYTLYRKWLEVNENKAALGYKALYNDEEFRAKYKADEAFRRSVDAFLMGLPERAPMNAKALKSYRDIETAQWLTWDPKWGGNFLDDTAIDFYNEGVNTEGIEPEVVLCREDKYLTEFWTLLRIFTSRFEHSSGPTRNLRFVVRDAVTGKVYGIFALSSDFRQLPCRDERIGWTREMRLGKHMLNNTAIGSTIVPTQPLGFNYRGGKLIALLAMSDVVEKAWKEVYGDVLVGVTTTSLYGAKSGKGTQYDGLKPYWFNYGESEGSSVNLKPTPPVWRLAKEYLYQTNPEKYWVLFQARRDTGNVLTPEMVNKALNYLYADLGISTAYVRSNHKRGVYFAPLYQNTNEFLRMEIDESQLVRKPNWDNSVAALTRFWKDKHAYKQINNLMEQHRVKYDAFVFYHDLAAMSWEEARDRYLTEEERQATAEHEQQEGNRTMPMTLDEFKEKWINRQNKIKELEAQLSQLRKEGADEEAMSKDAMNVLGLEGWKLARPRAKRKPAAGQPKPKRPYKKRAKTSDKKTDKFTPSA